MLAYRFTIVRPPLPRGHEKHIYVLPSGSKRAHATTGDSNTSQRHRDFIYEYKMDGNLSLVTHLYWDARFISESGAFHSCFDNVMLLCGCRHWTHTLDPTP